MFEWAWRGVGLVMISSACSGASPEEDARAVQASGANSENALTPTLPSPPSSSMPQAAAFASFVDPVTGQALQDVRDADREIVRFELQSQSMIWAATGNPVGGWITNGNDLRWERSGGAFRVRFGSEAGERRAYFTEADRGTICNLSISAPEQLSISPTSETPPGS
jgi:hypothetical protein